MIILPSRLGMIGLRAGGPPSTAGMVLWNKANAIGGLSNGDPISTWVNSSPNGTPPDDMTAAGADRPTYVTGLQNGMPAARFVRANTNVMTNGNFTNMPAGAFTVFVVAKGVTAGNDGALSQLIFDTSDQNDLTRRAMAFGSSGLYFFRGGTGYCLNTNVVAGTVQLYTGVCRGVGSELSVNGANTVTADIDASTASYPGFQYGRAVAAVSTGTFLDTDFYEDIWFDGDIGATRIGLWNTYLMTKYAL